MYLFQQISKQKYIYIRRSKSFKSFRVRKMGQAIPEFNEINNNGQMIEQLNLENQNQGERNIDME